MAQTPGVQRGPGEGVSFPNPLGGDTTFKVRGEDTGGVMTVLEGVAPPGQGPPLHLHPDADEIFYALEGAFRFRLRDEVREMPAGSCVFIPRGVAHTWQNVGDADARLFAVLTPAGLEHFFERFAQRPEGTSVTEAFRAIGAETGMHVVGPPLAQSHPRAVP